jgi:carbamoyl-phosphate synthase large subunit
LARELGVVGLLNVQYAVKGRDVYVLEVNPRASRTVPFVSKAIGVALAKVAARVMVGKRLCELGLVPVRPRHVSVKEAVFPFIKFPGVDTVLGPEMKSTGEVMGIDRSFGLAFAKAQIAAGTVLPTAGTVFVSVPDEDQEAAVPVACRLADNGLRLAASRGMAEVLGRAGLEVTIVRKVHEGSPHIVDAIRAGDIAMVINTPAGREAMQDAFPIRRAALECGIPYFTTLAGAAAAADGIAHLRERPLGVRALQDHHRGLAGGDPGV